MAMIAASALPSAGNVIEIKPNPWAEEMAKLTSVKMPGMSPRDYARYRKSCGRMKRKTNRLHLAKKAKIKRRRAA